VYILLYKYIKPIYTFYVYGGTMKDTELEELLRCVIIAKRDLHKIHEYTQNRFPHKPISVDLEEVIEEFGHLEGHISCMTQYKLSLLPAPD